MGGRGRIWEEMGKRILNRKTSLKIYFKTFILIIYVEKDLVKLLEMIYLLEVWSHITFFFFRVENLGQEMRSSQLRRWACCLKLSLESFLLDKRLLSEL